MGKPSHANIIAIVLFNTMGLITGELAFGNIQQLQ